MEGYKYRSDRYSTIHEEIIEQKNAVVAEDTQSAIFDALNLENIPASVSEKGFESLIQVDSGMQSLYSEADRIEKKYMTMIEGKSAPIDPALWSCAGAISAVFHKYSPGNKVNMEKRLHQFEGDQRVKASEMIRRGLGVCADKSSCAQYFQQKGFNSNVIMTDMRSPSTSSREKHACVLVSIANQYYIIDPNNPLVVGDNQIIPAIFSVKKELVDKIYATEHYDTGELSNIAYSGHKIRYAA